MNNLKFTILIVILAFAFYIVHSTLYINPTSAQNGPSCPAQSPYPRVIEGLISTPDISGSNNKFSNLTGTCVVNQLASFASYKIATYADLKSIYYTQSKASNKIVSNGNILANPANNTLYSYTNTTGVSTTSIISYGINIAVIFVENDLTINNNITGTTGGLVIVVAGDVNIATTVTRIDAVIISSGVIRTAGATCNHSSPVVASQLTINGSLISLNENKNIEFCRKIAGAGNNTLSAEVIIQQPKYLVILRNLFSDTLQKWSEIQ